MTNDLRNIEYLKAGNSRQQQAYQVLQETNVLSVLKNYDPIVVGTIPIGIDIENSDIDIVCYVSDFDTFAHTVRQNFSGYDSFEDWTKEKEKAYVTSFIYSGLEIEIFAQNKPSDLQNGFRHMVIENRILMLAGELFRKKIIDLKKQGYKTEPAFGILLNLDEPYSDLLNFEKYTDEELNLLIKERYRD